MYRPPIYVISRSRNGNSARNSFKTFRTKKEIRERVKVKCRDNFIQYMSNTTLHGLRYVGDKNLSNIERWTMHSNNFNLNMNRILFVSNRFFFALTFLLVSILSVYFISNIWIKWSASPVIITLNSLSMSISELPFPAITICNMNQAQNSSVQLLSKNSDEYSIVQSICTQAVDNEINNTKSGKWPAFRKMLLKVFRIM